VGADSEVKWSKTDFQGLKRVEIFELDWSEFEVINDSVQGASIILNSSSKQIPIHFILPLSPITETSRSKFYAFLQANVLSFNHLPSLLIFNEMANVLGIMDEFIEERIADISVIPQKFYSTIPKDLDLASISFPVILSTERNVQKCASSSALNDFIQNCGSPQYLWIKSTVEGETILLKQIGSRYYSIEKGKLKDLEVTDKYYRLLSECSNQLQLDMLTIELVKTKTGDQVVNNILPYVIPSLKQEQHTFKTQINDKVLTLLKKSKRVRSPKKPVDILRHPLVLFQTFLIIALMSILYAMYQTSLLPRDSYNNIIPPFSKTL